MSLYIQITKRCNMSCNHCSFSCGERGPDMDAAIFRRVLELSEREETPITLGGGEPTLHPLFMDFLWWSIRAKAALTDELGMPAVGLVTNGSRTAVALELAALAKVGVICASVSQDEFHDPIDPRVFRAFEPSKQPGDYRRINTLRLIVPAGRAKRWGNHPFRHCVCDGPFVTPSGDLYSCGCRLRKLGHAADTALRLPEEWRDIICPNEQALFKRGPTPGEGATPSVRNLHCENG